eukprot:TRINITY_DN531_c0_g1_i5.p1 TRINITY_DN531_c0_g1~~TRINITY_DN531_c0_g1_i5.p1  ORF type:complete len:517 (-),score=141.78 TRINITY_DN531_c0_g1_i5:112-1662(-)
MQSPVPFVVLESQSGQLQIHPRAAAYFEKLEAPVCVLSIAGFQASGKSFLLNQLLGTQEGFAVSADQSPCTEGLWFWAVDSSVLSSLGHELPANSQLIIIDSEGLPDKGQGEVDDYSVNLFALALLSGSYFIYNDRGTIDDSALDRLRFVPKLSKLIRVQSDVAGDPYELRIFFPTFLWLLRDFSGELLQSGKPISAKEFMEGNLVAVRGNTPAIASRNLLRTQVVQHFGDRDCLTVAPAGSDGTSNSSIDPESLPERFIHDLEVLRKKVFSSLRPKSLFGHNLTGAMLLNVMEGYVACINAQKPICIKSSWNSTALEECRKGLKAGQQTYQQRFAEEMAGKTSHEYDALEQSHWLSLWESWAAFKKHAVGDEMAHYEEQLLAFVHGKFSQTCAELHTESLSTTSQTLKGFTTKIDDFVFRQCSTADALEEEWTNLFEKYIRTTSGLARYETLAAVMAKLPLEHANIVAGKMVDETRKLNEEKLQDAQQRADQDYSRLEELHGSVLEKLHQSKVSA